MWGIDLDYVEKTFEKEGYDYIVNLAGKFKNYGLIRAGQKKPGPYEPGEDNIR